jgi:ubiquinone biosynthesis protein
MLVTNPGFPYAGPVVAARLGEVDAMLREALSTARDLGRLHEIASVLVRHGLGDVVRRLGIAGLLERAGKVLRWEATAGLSQKAPPQHFRETLEDLGPTFVKLGQILAGRTDLLPPEWTDELARLHEQATPVPQDRVRSQVAADLGADPDELFSDFDPSPLAAASIAQVHRAELPDGTPVVLKIRRPGIRAVVEADLRLMRRMAELIHNEMPEMRRFRPRNLVRQFERTLRNELDLRMEARNVERLAQALDGAGNIVIPRVHSRYTCEQLIVLDYLGGTSIDEWLRSGKPGDADPKQIAKVGADAVLRMVLAEGFFHADPHPGNVLLLDDGRLGLLDFGMVGRLSESRRMEFIQLLFGVVERRELEVVDLLLGWSQDAETDIDQLTQDTMALLDRYHGVPLKHLDLTAMLTDTAALLRDNNLFLPNDVALLLKVFITLDSLGRKLDPDFEMVSHVEPFARRVMRAHWSPGAVARRGVLQMGQMLVGLPNDVRRLMISARRGRFKVEVDMRRLETFGQQINRSANRLTVGVVTSALIVGTAIALTVSGGPTIFGLPLFAFLGFLGSIGTGVWLLWSILRSAKR